MREKNDFKSRATRLYTPLCRSVRRSVGPSHFPQRYFHPLSLLSTLLVFFDRPEVDVDVKIRDVGLDLSVRIRRLHADERLLHVEDELEDALVTDGVVPR